MRVRRSSLSWAFFALLAAIQVVLYAASSVAAPRSLVVDHLGNGDQLAVDLMATGQFDQVVNRSGLNGVPALEELLLYDSVLYYTNQSQPDPDATGDLLADYVDAGGHLVMATYAFGGTVVSVGGRIVTPGYAPLVTSGRSPGIVSGDVIPLEPDDPIFDDVDPAAITFSVNASYPRPDLDAGAALLAVDAFDRRMIARNSAGNVVAINIFPRPDDMNEDGDRLFANALQPPQPVPPCALPDTLRFVELVSTGTTLVPGTSRPFAGLDPPGLAERRVVFRGQSANGEDRGIFIADCGGVHTVADLATVIPGGSFGSFTGFAPDPAFDGTKAAFVGIRDSDGEPGFLPRRGIYRGDGISPAVELIAQDGATIRPMDWSGSIYMEGYWGELAIHGDTVDFRQRDLSTSADRGFYRWESGEIIKLYDNAQFLGPGIEPPSFHLGRSHFRHLASEGGDAVIYTVDIARQYNIDSRDEIVILDNGTSRTQIARTGDQPVGTTGASAQIQEVAEVDSDGEHFVMKAINRGLEQGYYQVAPGGLLEQLVSEQTPIPGTSETFDGGLGEIAVDAGWIVFMGQADVTGGLDTLAAIRDGQIRKIVQRGDEVGGRMVSSIGFRSEGLDDGRVAYLLRFEDGGVSIVVEALEPVVVPVLQPMAQGALALLVMATSMVVSRRRARP